MDITLHENDKLLTIEQVARRLNISEGKVYGMVKTNELPNLKMGRLYRVWENDLNSFIFQHMHFGNFSK